MNETQSDKGEQKSRFGGDESVSPLRVGNQVFIRCVTHYYTGRIVYLDKEEIVLVDACWIADTGRFSEALKTGKFQEVEPFCHPVTVSRGGLIDATDFPYELPRAVT